MGSIGDGLDCNGAVILEAGTLAKVISPKDTIEASEV